MMKESQLGLSLRLQTSPTTNIQSHGREEDDDDKEENNKKEELTSSSLASSLLQNKLQRTELAGISSHVASQPNRKARVSVRARCESATVSIISYFFYTYTLSIYSFIFHAYNYCSN